MARTTKKAKAPEPVETIAAPEPPEVVYFSEASWKGVITVWQCATCQHCENEKDDMIIHVLKHVPEKERDALLDKLTKGNK